MFLNVDVTSAPAHILAISSRQPPWPFCNSNSQHSCALSRCYCRQVYARNTRLPRSARHACSALCSYKYLWEKYSKWNWGNGHIRNTRPHYPWSYARPHHPRSRPSILSKDRCRCHYTHTHRTLYKTQFLASLRSNIVCRFCNSEPSIFLVWPHLPVRYRFLDLRCGTLFAQSADHCLSLTLISVSRVWICLRYFPLLKTLISGVVFTSIGLLTITLCKAVFFVPASPFIRVILIILIILPLLIIITRPVLFTLTLPVLWCTCLLLFLNYSSDIFGLCFGFVCLCTINYLHLHTNVRPSPLPAFNMLGSTFQNSLFPPCTS